MLTAIEKYTEGLSGKKKESFIELFESRARCFTAKDKDLVFFEPKFNGMAWLGETPRGDWEVIAYSGRRKKQDFYYRYSAKEHAEQKIEFWAKTKLDEVERKEKQKELHKKLQNAIDKHVQVGDIFIDSWGYEQTNIDYYQLVALKGKKTGVFREIAGEMIEKFRGDSGRIKPCPDEFVGEEFEKRITLHQYDEKSNVSAHIKTRSFSFARLKRKNEDGTYSSDHCSWGY